MHRSKNYIRRQIEALTTLYKNCRGAKRYEQRDEIMLEILNLDKQLRAMSEEELRQTRKKHGLDSQHDTRSVRGPVGERSRCDCGAKSHAHHINCPKHPCNEGDNQ